MREFTSGCERLLDLTWQDFEAVVTSFLSKAGWDVLRSRFTRDGGIDVYVSRGGRRGIVQCKRWRKPVGAPVVRDLLGAGRAESADELMLVTTSRLTKPAWVLAYETQVQAPSAAEFWDRLCAAGLDEMVDRLADAPSAVTLSQTLQRFLRERGAGQRPKSLLVCGRAPRARPYKMFARWLASELRCRLTYLRESTVDDGYEDYSGEEQRAPASAESHFDERLRGSLRRTARRVMYTSLRPSDGGKASPAPVVAHPDVFDLSSAPPGAGFVPSDPRTWQFEYQLLIFVDGLERLLEHSRSRLLASLPSGQWRPREGSTNAISLCPHVIVVTTEDEALAGRVASAFEKSMRTNEIPWRIIESRSRRRV